MKKNIIRIVKMTAYYSLLGFFLQGFIFNLIFAFTPSEGQNLSQIKVTVNLNKVSFESALQHIEKQSSLKFFYVKDEIPVDEKVTIDVTNESLYDVLKTLASQYNLVFQRINSQIVIKKGTSYEREDELVVQGNGAIRGRITDSRTGEGLIGANILIQGTSLGTTTDDRGNYRLEKLDAGTYTVVVQYLGYLTRTESVNVVENRTVEINFQLEQSEIQMSEVVVTTSTVIPTPVKKLPNTISVVTARDLERMNPTNVAEVVRLAVPGAFYSDEGVGTTYGAFSVRGVSSIQGVASTLKVYVDGVEVSDPAYVTYMDPSSIQRVEVVPGPQASTIYGSRAISGVMQIFTKQGVQGRTRLSGKVGMKTMDGKYVGNKTPLGQESSLNAMGGFSIFNFNAGVNYKNEPQWIDLFEEQALNLSGSGRFNTGDFSGGVSITYSKRNNVSGWDPLTYKRDKELNRPLTAPNRVTESTYGTYSLNLIYKAAENWTHNLTAGYNALSRFSYDRSPNATTKLYSVSESTDQRYSMAYNTSYQFDINEMFNSAITAGLDWTEYSLPFFSGNVADRQNYEFVDSNPGKKKNFGFFAQTQTSYNDFLFLTAGLRADKRPSAAEEPYTWSPRLGLSGVYEMEDWMFKGRIAWGQSVIVPDERYIAGAETATSVVLPNLNLLSQVQRGYELGADVYYMNLFTVSLTYFDQRPLDLIEMVNLGRDSQNRVMYQYQNLSEVKNQGFEIKGIFNPLIWLTFNVNYGKTTSTVLKLGPNYTGTLKVGGEIVGRPEYTISTNIEITPVEGTTITLSAFRFGEWIAADFYGYLYDVYGGKYNAAVKPYPNGYYITYPSFTKINAGVTQRISETLSGYLQIDNLTNDDSFERINTAVTQPRTVTIGVMFNGLTL